MARLAFHLMAESQTDNRVRDYQLGLLGTTIAVTAWGTSTVLLKYIDMGGIAIGFWRFSLYAAVLCTWMMIRKTPLSIRALRASFGGGVSLGLDVIFFFTAIKLTNIVNATTIGALQPLVVGVFAARYLGERISARNIAAAAVALLAVIVIVVESSGTPEWNGWGDLAAVAALFCWSAYFIFSKRSKGVITPQEYTAGTGVWTAVICLVVGLAVGQDMSPPAAGDWLPIVVLTFGAGVLGHSIMNWSLVRIPLWMGSTFTLLVPVVSSLTAWIFLDETLTAIQVVAMAVVIASLAAIVSSQREPLGEDPAPELLTT